MNISAGKDRSVRGVKLLRTMSPALNIKYWFGASKYIFEESERNSVFSDSDKQSVPTNVDISSYKVPECDVAPFDGRFQNCPELRDLFTAVFV